RTNRRKGLPFAAERALELMRQDQETWNAINAYSDGVNAFIQSLAPHDYPIEYKILGYAPEPWSPFKSALLQKYMANTLTGGTSDIENTNALAVWGKDVFDILYPEYPSTQEPIVPKYTRFRRRDFNRPPPPPADYHPDSLFLNAGNVEPKDPDEVILGSNNWAVSGQKSASGYPMLANDPHLGLNLPSIWYEIQLHAPSVNAYGVSLPGAPAIIIGFNDSIAWGATNGAQDVLDYYTITFRNEQAQEYLYDGEWLPVRNRIETHKIKGEVPFLDTVRYTHIGPVMYDENFKPKPMPLAVRWMAHEPSNEMLAFHRLNRAKNYEEYLAAFETYICPAQNFVFASSSGDIAIWQHGQFVNKWDQQGRFVLDGSRKDHMWGEYVPREQIPHVYNPEQGFVQSANQHPTSPYYPYYYNGRFEAYRGRRIYELLASKDTLTFEDMRAFHMDNYSMAAYEALPLMLGMLDTTQFMQQDQQVYETLKSWDYRYDPEKIAPTIYDMWWRTLYRAIWNDEFEPLEERDILIASPKTVTTIQILRDSSAFTFYDILGDTTRRTREQLVNYSFERMVTELNDKYPEAAERQWGKTRQTDIRHLSRVLTPFSRTGLATGGMGRALNATGRYRGPSWRMVVMLGPEVKGYGVYPGGQSGHPGDADYDGFIDKWMEGNYYELRFMKHAQDGTTSEDLNVMFEPAPSTD
ncbi:MAG: penicillin acylase family protein, partial [Bacteroidota bacterium]